jgi:hypothetical protein
VFCKQKDGKLSKEDLIQMLSAMLVVRSENRASHELVGIVFISVVRSENRASHELVGIVFISVVRSENRASHELVGIVFISSETYNQT